jgi:hypothetical protein
MTQKQITPAVKSAVNAYLMARTHAELQREKIDKIQRRLLATADYFPDPELVGRREMSGPIKDPKFTYLLKEDEFADYLTDLKQELVKAGYEIKHTEGEPEHSYNCPALTAENLQTKAEWILVDASAEMLGEKDDFRNRLLCAGLDKYRQFIDLTVKLVVSQPDFRNPLTQEVVA